MSNFGVKDKPFQTQGTRVLLAVLIVLNLFVFGALFSKSFFGLFDIKVSPELKIDFVNVGQGDCCVIRTPGGRTFVVDGGTNVTEKEAEDSGRELIYKYVKKLNVSKIDGVVVTHWHVDDYSGLIPLLKQYKVSCLYETPIGFINEFYQEFDDVCKAKNVKRITVMSGSVLEWGEELFVQVLNPEEIFGSAIHSEVNNDAIVLLIRYGKVQVLLCADIQEDAEREVIKFNEGIKSQIIKVPDHGAERSAYKPFFKMVGAKDGIISVGANNKFGYPSNKTLDIFEELGMNIYRTDYNGNIHLKIGGKDEKDYSISIDRRI
jgi:competence protein ComEC